MEQVRLATRGSALARRQAAAVAERLETRRRSVELVEVETRGDRLRDELIARLGRTGAFVRALDERVLDGDVDAAVHSLKDVPTEMPEALSIAAVPERAPAGDVLVTPAGDDLAALPDGAVVGTSSLRRTAQLRAARPDLEVVPLRGNVDTRIEKLLAPHLQREHTRRLEAAGDLDAAADADDTDDADDTADEPAATVDRTYERSPSAWFEALSEIERRALERSVDRAYDAIVLAEAGLDRLGLLEQLAVHRLSPDTFVPAPGQGAIAVTASEDTIIDRLRSAVDHPPTRVAVTAERTVLAHLGGGCVAPVGIHARLRGPVVRTRVRVLSRAGDEEVAAARDLPVEKHPDAAAAFAADLADRGAATLIAEAKRDFEAATGPDTTEDADADVDATGGESP